MGKRQKRVTLYTVGYEGRTPSALVRRLAEAGVVRVVDVRLTPTSRRAGFSLMALFQSLRRRGIAYEHVRELGNPLEIRGHFKNGNLEEGRVRFRQVLENGATAAVDYVLDLSQVAPTAILCVEAEASACHRSVIAEVARERMSNLEVVDL